MRSAYRNKGVQMMLDAVVDYMPSPLDIPPITGVNPKTGKEEERPADDNGSFAALAFKIMADPFVGSWRFSECILELWSQDPMCIIPLRIKKRE